MSPNKTISMSNIVINYLRVLEVISSLNCELIYKSGVGRKQKMSDLEVVALSLTAEFMSIDSENSLFKLEKTVKLTTTFQSKLTIDFGAN